MFCHWYFHRIVILSGVIRKAKRVLAIRSLGVAFFLRLDFRSSLIFRKANNWCHFHFPPSAFRSQFNFPLRILESIKFSPLEFEVNWNSLPWFVESIQVHPLEFWCRFSWKHRISGMNFGSIRISPSKFWSQFNFPPTIFGVKSIVHLRFLKPI